VLVVEDQPDNQRLVSALLALIGQQVRLAADGYQAIEQFRLWQPHLVLMDMRMPGMDGYQATRTIRALPGGDRAPIVALTASVFEEDRPRILAAGCNEVLRKPVEEEAFFALLGRLLGLRYDYDNNTNAAAAGQKESDASSAPLASRFASLPADLRQRLRDAALALDAVLVRDLIAEIEPSAPQLAAEARLLADGFAFDRLASLCEDG